MKILLSPSKTLDETSALPKCKTTMPQFVDETEVLVKVMRKATKPQLKKLMDISDKLAELNHARFQSFQFPFTAKNARPALFTFKGDVYDGLAAEDFTAKEVERAQEQIRILSGLYGLLRPLDLIQPYRLEMGIALKNPRGKNLYQFWGDRITDALTREKPDAVINLASEEYFSAVNTKKLKAPLITPVFKEKKGKDYKVIGLMAKRARGMMARFAVKHDIKKPEDLKAFKEAKYSFNEALSSSTIWVFTR
ncbi:MAG: peroxide stress protein YaaA [Proteobacteria bacterium]|nr:peroxide stress protein YaaA [Pseudomonadota bacterium]